MDMQGAKVATIVSDQCGAMRCSPDKLLLSCKTNLTEVLIPENQGASLRSWDCHFSCGGSNRLDPPIRANSLRPAFDNCDN